DVVVDPALSPEGEAEHRAFDVDVPATERGEPEGPVLARVLVVADADQGLVEQAHHRGEDLPAAEILRTQIALHPLADVRKDLAELEHPAELRLVARLPIERVVAVLLAPARVARRHLDVAAGIRTDPDAAPGRRNHQRLDPPAGDGVADPFAVGREERPAL